MEKKNSAENTPYFECTVTNKRNQKGQMKIFASFVYEITQNHTYKSLKN